MLVCVIGGLACCAAATAVTSDSSDSSSNPYQSIVDRNVFSLKPPPAPVDSAEANKAPVLKITLTGMTTIFGNKRVLMKTAPPPGKPGEAPKTEQFYILTEGQREGDIEVLEIDEKVGSVKVNNAGTPMTLTFEKDGAKLPSTPPPAVPGVPPNGVPPLPGARALPQPPGTVPNPSFQLPTRIPRLPTPGSQASGVNPGGVGSPLSANPGYLPGNTSLPGFQNNTMPGAAQNLSQAALPTRQYSLEEQAILIEATRQAGGPTAGLLPPTALTPKSPVTDPNTQPGQSTQPPMILPPVPGSPLTPGQY